MSYEIRLGHCGLYGLTAFVLRDGTLIAFFPARKPEALVEGDVFSGRIDRISPALDLAFVDLGEGKKASLSARDIPPSRRRGKASLGQILSAGQWEVMQVTASTLQRGGQDKPARVSLDPVFKSPALIYFPQGRKIGHSRTISATAFNLADYSGLTDRFGGGWILRKAALGMAQSDLFQEARILAQIWQEIQAKAPAQLAQCLHEAPAPLIQAITAYASGLPDCSVLFCGLSPAEERDMRAQISTFPSLSALPCATSDSGAVAEMEEEILQLAHHHIPFSGGSLVIERLTALTAIDINATGESHMQNVNLAALRESARQIRLRNISGNILLDPIGNLHKPEVAQPLLAALAEGFTDDPVPVQLHGVTRMGLIEISRARRGMEYPWSDNENKKR